jgi:hypothetical protein
MIAKENPGSFLTVRCEEYTNPPERGFHGCPGLGPGESANLRVTRRIKGGDRHGSQEEGSKEAGEEGREEEGEEIAPF